MRPIVQVDGSAKFNEAFFNDARGWKGNVVGGVDNGWKVAMTTLGLERGSSVTTSHRRVEKELDQIIGIARANGASRDPVIRQHLAAAHTKVQIMRINGPRTLSSVRSGKKGPGVAALGATNKVFWSEYHRDVMELALDVIGSEAQLLTGSDEDQNVPGVGRRRGSKDHPVSPLQAAFLFRRSETIWGGTAEIQRNSVGERVLGRPKETGAGA